ncbi:TetR family transcriptional regulator [Nonomuraea polychroma]|uniref:TetR family transcriptional regulator n=1 Tax=Nonomuraea polychroma TaxID=46176 RepID=A0A438MI92_9ACTN|nr:TetR/AcrR family transcriptional regulator [Nonomuraea polychroma]RVX45151.1 TetR family transcriptional regulator [Nonomuraea polychroma]
MGRPAKFSHDEILDAALAITAEDGLGAATMAAIAARVGAPTGSLYHRFGSHDLLLAALWTRTVRSFQRGFVDALVAGDAEMAALHTPKWCRQHPAEAALLLLHRRQELAARWPAELGEDLDTVNTQVSDALSSFAARPPGVDLEKLIFATVDVPYGAVRRYLLAGRPPPLLVDELITSVCRAVLPLSEA